MQVGQTCLFQYSVGLLICWKMLYKNWQALAAQTLRQLQHVNENIYDTGSPNTAVSVTLGIKVIGKCTHTHTFTYVTSRSVWPIHIDSLGVMLSEENMQASSESAIYGNTTGNNTTGCYSGTRLHNYTWDRQSKGSTLTASLIVCS